MSDRFNSPSQSQDRYQRMAEERVDEALTDTPVVLFVGPRRAGKTTLVQRIGAPDRTYLTLDDPSVREAAQADPVGFVRELARATIAEIQRAPELMLSIKQKVDENYRPGHFLLTGSADILTLPRLPDSLAGRMEIIRMFPLAQAEIAGVNPTFLENVFAGNLASEPNAILGLDLVRLVLQGGFPEALARDSERRRRAWGRSYLQSILTRDLPDVAAIARPNELLEFVAGLAEQSGRLINYSQLGSRIGVSHRTGQRYARLLEQVFLVATLRPWYTEALPRIVRTAKLHFLDTGLLATIRGWSFDRVQADRHRIGPLLETFVFGEIRKLMAASRRHFSAYHFRDQQMREVDIVLERDDGRIVGIKVKASATVKSADFGGLRTLAEASGDRFAYGVVLYDSAQVVPFGDRLAAAPVSSLWSST